MAADSSGWWDGVLSGPAWSSSRYAQPRNDVLELLETAAMMVHHFPVCICRDAASLLAFAASWYFLWVKATLCTPKCAPFWDGRFGMGRLALALPVDSNCGSLFLHDRYSTKGLTIFPFCHCHSNCQSMWRWYYSYPEAWGPQSWCQGEPSCHHLGWWQKPTQCCIATTAADGKSPVLVWTALAAPMLRPTAWIPHPCPGNEGLELWTFICRHFQRGHVTISS